MKIDSSGYAVFDHSPDDELKARYKGYCVRCFHTYWQGEIVVKHPQGKKGFVHRDCLVALADSTPRKFNTDKAGLGKMDKSIIKKKAKLAIRKNQ
jgi:hypothetical protein